MWGVFIGGSAVMKKLKYNFLLSSIAILVVFAAVSSAQTILTTLDGARVDIAGQRGKVVVLAIGATWLPLSTKQAEYTNTLAKKYAGRDVVFYFVSTDSANTRSKNFVSPVEIKHFVTTAKLNVQMLRDPDGAETIKKFGIEQVPSFVILDKAGKLSGEPFGGIDPKYDITVPISRAIDRLL